MPSAASRAVHGLAVLLLLLFSACHVLASTPDRKIDLLFGVPRSKHALYSKPTFECLDKSKQIPSSAVNDDYCDCPDGSDEPGSSACNNGLFYCANEGFRGTYISSTRVNDGICDPECCDGSDEIHGGLMSCPNRCKEQGEIYKKKLAEEQKIWKKAQAEKKRTLEQSKKSHSEWEKEIEKLTADAQALEKNIDRLHYVKAKGEEWEAKRKRKNPSIDVLTELYQRMQTESNDRVLGLTTRLSDLRRTLENAYDVLDVLEDLVALLQAVPDDSAVRTDTLMVHVYEKVEAYRNVKDTHDITRESILNAVTQDKQAEDAGHSWSVNQEVLAEMSSRVTEQVKNALEAQESAKIADDVCGDPHTSMSLCLSVTLKRTWAELKQAAEAMVVWPGWGKAVTRSLKVFDSIIGRPKPGGGDAKKGTSATSAVAHDPSEKEDDDDDDNDKPQTDLGDLTPEEVANAKYNLQMLSDSLSENTRKLSDVNEKLEELKRKRGVDYGPDGIWESLSGKCFSIDTAEYKYEACLFDRATQSNKNGHGGTSLGSFKRWGPRSDLNPNAPKYHYMMFEGGERCWNGPERSVELTFECGPDNVVVSVSEPSKCEYALRFKTPLVCPDNFSEDTDGVVDRDEL